MSLSGWTQSKEMLRRTSERQSGTTVPTFQTVNQRAAREKYFRRGQLFHRIRSGFLGAVSSKNVLPATTHGFFPSECMELRTRSDEVGFFAACGKLVYAV
jgi:hypothetical protein